MTLKRYIVRTLAQNFRKVREPHQVIDMATARIVDEYHSKRAAEAHARELNRQERGK